MRNRLLAALAFGLLIALPAAASDWSDTYVGFRTGHHYKETGNPDSIDKYILSLNHVSGYSLGQNFFGVDFLRSNGVDPANTSSPGKSNGANEAYLAYRHDLDFGKLFHRTIDFGPVRGLTLTTGLDYNTKNTTFAPATLKLLIGPSLQLKVPGYFNVGLLYDQERNHNAFGGYSQNYGGGINVKYDPTYMIATSWGIPVKVANVNTTVKGFGNYTGPKGKDGSGVESKAETLIRAYWMVDAGAIAGMKSGVWQIGPGWEFWNNKFGIPRYEAGQNRPQGTQVNPRTNTIVFAAEAHF